MKDNIFIKILSSLPIILLALYFSKFIGICLILLRLFISEGKKKNLVPIYIIIAGALILLPKGIEFIGNNFDLDISTIPFLNEILTSKIYDAKLIEYSKSLIITGVIFTIIGYVFSWISSKISSKVNFGIIFFILSMLRRDAAISKQNDMEIKEKQQKAKNTSYVKCPNCGSDNLIGEKFGTCKFCRSKLENENFEV